MEGFIAFLAFLAFVLTIPALIWVLLTYFEGKSDAVMKYMPYDNKYGPILGYVYEFGYRAGEHIKVKPTNLSKNKTRFNR